MIKGKKSKYNLVVNHVIDRILNKQYKLGDKIPSVNEFREMYNLSRDTVFSGLKELRYRNIVDSEPGVGYFITSIKVTFSQNIFLLFNEFNEFKEDLYNSFVKAIGDDAIVDLYFHNYNRQVFETLIKEANGKYTTYIIMSGKFAGIDSLLQGLSGHVLLLDHFHPELEGKYSSVAQNFAKDTYKGLLSGIDHLKKYKRLIMVQKDEKEPIERYDGLLLFCKEFSFKYEYIGTVNARTIEPGDVFIVVNDRDLVDLIKISNTQKLRIGKDFGIISYNDTPLKEVLSGGITTLSTDFKQMGETMAALVNDDSIRTIENPCRLNMRNSL